MYIAIYHRTGFKCDNLLNAKCEFFFAVRNNWITEINAKPVRSIPQWAQITIIKFAISSESTNHNYLSLHLKPVLWYMEESTEVPNTLEKLPIIK